MKLTRSAVDRSKALILEHPEDPIVRVQVKDVDEQRLAFSVTLQDRVRSDDQAQTVDGLTVSIPATKKDRSPTDGCRTIGRGVRRDETQESIQHDGSMNLF